MDLRSAKRPSKPTFLWQALLIVLPVAALAIFGFFSLRQDRVLAQHEATERAQSFADDLLAKLWVTLTASYLNEKNAFQVDRNGELIFPAAYPLTPVPQPLNLADLDPAQASLWQAAQRADADPNVGEITAAYDHFIAANPPARFAAAAHYNLALGLSRQGKLEAAADNFARVVTAYPQAVGESGLPLLPLAQVKLLELATLATNAAAYGAPDLICSNAVTQPTTLTPYMLDRCSEAVKRNPGSNTVLRWQELWQAQELLREQYAAARPYLEMAAATNLEDTARLCWMRAPLQWHYVLTNVTGVQTNGAVLQAPVQMSGSDWLLARVGGVAGEYRFTARPRPEIGAYLATVASFAPRLPAYFGLDVELAGRTLPGLARDLRVWREIPGSVKSGSVRKEVSSYLATTVLASAVKGESGAELLKVTIYLTSPATLYQLQTARTFWFGALILIAALAAVIGLLAAGRAFHRQLKLSEMKSNFVASVSHELRAPIASVRLMAESLERGKVSDPAKQNEYFRFIGQESRRLSSLIENVLDFSRIEQGRKQYEFEPTDLVALARQTVKIMEPNAAERQIMLKLALNNAEPGTGDLQPVLDGRAIQQALVNLLDNAIKHSRAGQTVTLGVEEVISNQYSVISVQNSESNNPTIQQSIRPPTPQPTPRVKLYVEDAGEGIPAEEHEKIFGLFYRLGSELRRETQGVGIGLSIVKHIVEAHGGRVVVRSAVGQGSRFTMELPVEPGKVNDE